MDSRRSAVCALVVVVTKTLVRAAQATEADANLAAGITDGRLDAVLDCGLGSFCRELFREDGAPKYYQSSFYPIDAQCAAQGIQTFAIASRTDVSYARTGVASFAGYTLGHVPRNDVRSSSNADACGTIDSARAVVRGAHAPCV